VNPFQFGAAVALLAGALIAVSSRDPRWALAGVVISLGLAPVLADPPPAPLAIAVRLIGALLGTQLGPVSIALGATAAAVVGYATSGVGSAAVGPPLATAVGFGLATLAVGPLLLGRDILRVGIGMVLLITAGELARAGWAGTPSALEQVVAAGLTLAVLAATAAIAASAQAAGHDLAVEGRAPRETLFEAHPLATVSRRPAPGLATIANRAARPGSIGAGRSGMAPGPRPGAVPRRDAAAHQLTLEERFRLAGPADADATVQPELDAGGGGGEADGGGQPG
jgi:hypothetical protein